jgi:hypothetical protein
MNAVVFSVLAAIGLSVTIGLGTPAPAAGPCRVPRQFGQRLRTEICRSSLIDASRLLGVFEWMEKVVGDT